MNRVDGLPWEHGHAWPLLHRTGGRLWPPAFHFPSREGTVALPVGRAPSPAAEDRGDRGRGRPRHKAEGRRATRPGEPVLPHPQCTCGAGAPARRRRQGGSRPGAAAPQGRGPPRHRAEGACIAPSPVYLWGGRPRPPAGDMGDHGRGRPRHKAGGGRATRPKARRPSPMGTVRTPRRRRSAPASGSHARSPPPRGSAGPDSPSPWPRASARIAAGSR